jgi:hypothetical protein
MRTLIAIGVSCLALITPVHAAPTLLAEFKYHHIHATGSSRVPIPSEIQFKWVLHGTQWSRQATISDLGQTFAVEPLDEMAAIWPTAESTLFEVTNCLCGHSIDLSSAVASLGEFPDFSPSPLTWRVHVPNPQATHSLSSVNVTIDDWLSEQSQSGAVNYGGAMTVRLYGEVLPEPGSIVMLVMGVLLTLALRLRGR